MRSRARLVLALLALSLAGRAVLAQPADRSFTTSDGVHLHYLEAGPSAAHTIVLVPGWTMPAWIFQPQIAAFSRTWHVIAFDPRGQGASEIPLGGYEPVRRGQDIAELLDQLGRQKVVLLGWSLGVLDSLAYVHTHGPDRLAGLVLIDNSIGEDPAPTGRHGAGPHRPFLSHEVGMRRFVASMFLRPQPEAYLEALTEASLRTPLYASRALLAYPVPRIYWREAVYMVHAPILYVVRPNFAGQAGNLARHDPEAETVVLGGVGHAMFIDDATGFNALVQDFLTRRVWR
jgi:microsomal epoxide hydrolase